MHETSVENLLEEPLSLTALLQHIELDFSAPLTSQIYHLLRDAIIMLRLAPGQLVSEKEIAEVLSASKTPVREALIRLEIDGLVDIVPKSGTYVTPIRINKYMEACFTRLQLEIGAVRRAAEHAEEQASLQKLEFILEQQEAALNEEDYQRFFTLDQDLHQAFFNAAGVPGAWETLLRTQADVNRMRHIKRIKKIRRGPTVLKQHTDIVEAILIGDPDKAEKALIAHIGSLEQEIQQLSTNRALLDFIDNQAQPSRRPRTTHRSGV